MKILFVSEIVSKGGIFATKKLLKKIKEENNIDFTIANGNRVTGGFGLGKNHSIYLHKLGADVITSGECIYYKKDMVTYLPKCPYILRGANFPKGNPGRGWGTYNAKSGGAITVINLLGQSGYPRVHANNPFTYAPEILERVKEKSSVIIVNYHAATTAEKKSMGLHLDGKVSAVIGSGSRAMTADLNLSDSGTVAITDSGRTGSINSVGGLDPEIEINKFLTQIPERSKDCFDKLELQGLILDIDENSGKTTSANIVREECEGGELDDAVRHR